MNLIKKLLAIVALSISIVVGNCAPTKTVIGPDASTTANSIPRWTDTTAFKIKGSPVTINDAGVISGLTGISLNSHNVYSITNGNSIILTTNGTILSIHGTANGITLVVASSTTSLKGNYLCDGSGDQVEINQALNALPATGGTVMLTDGTYTIADYITMPSNSRLVMLPGTKIIVVDTYTPTLKTLNGITVKPILTNSDHSNGNTNISVIGPGLLTMRGTTQIDTKSYTGIWFNKTTNAVIEGVEISHILEGVTTNGGSQATNRFYGVFLTETADSRVSDSLIHDTGDDCINICRSSVRNMVYGNRIHASTFGHSVQIEGDSALLFGGNAPIGNIIANNNCSSNRLEWFQGGITIHGGTDNTVIGNTIVKSGYGVGLVGNSKRNVVSGNAIGDVYNWGILVHSDVTATTGTSDNILTGNTIQLNTVATNGIYVYSTTQPITNLLISANTIIGSNGDAQHGIFLLADTHDIDLVHIQDNVISGVGLGGIHTDTTSSGTDITRINVQNNRITDSGVGVFIVNNGGAIVRKGMITGNYIETSRVYGGTATAGGGVQINTSDSFYVANNKAIVTGRAFSETGTANTNIWVWNDTTGSVNTIQSLRGSQSTGMTMDPLTLLDGDINNPFTTLYTQTNTWFVLESILPTSFGGARLTGMTDGDNSALSLRGLIGSTNPTDAFPAVGLVGAKLSGTDKAALGNAETVLGMLNNTSLIWSIFGDGSVQQLGPLSIPSLTVTNGAIFQNVTASKLAVFDSIKGLTNSTLADSDIVTTISTNIFTNKTLNISDNVLIQFKYQDFLSPTLVDGVGAVFNATTTSRNYRHAIFSGSQETNANYVEYVWAVPNDIDTSRVMQATLKIVTGGVDTDAYEFRIKMVDTADSGQATSTSFINIIAINSGTLSSPAANDVFTSIVTLTGWNSSITAADHIVIRLERLDNSNDDAIAESLLRIGYFSAQ